MQYHSCQLSVNLTKPDVISEFFQLPSRQLFKIDFFNEDFVMGWFLPPTGDAALKIGSSGETVLDS